MTMQAYPKEGGEALAYGQELSDHNGKKAFFLKVARESGGSSTGRILTIRPSKDWPDHVEPTLEALLEDQRVNHWPHQLSWQAEYFPGVYDLVIR